MSDFTLYTPDELAEKVESKELKGFMLKRYVGKCYQTGAFAEDHEGYLVYADKNGPSRAGLSAEQMVEYYRNAWATGLNSAHPDVAALLGDAGSPPAKVKEPAPEPAKEEGPKEAQPKKRTTRQKEEEVPAQAPPTVADNRLLMDTIAKYSDRTIEAVAAMVPSDLTERLERIEGKVGSLHDRVGGLEEGQGQIKAGVAYLAEGMMSPEARQEVVDIMDMSLDELVEAGFGKNPS
jgi:hypothetical protein